MKKKLPQEDTTPHATPAVEREGEAFGIWLRRQREGRGIELEEIAQSSRISMTYLRAFEEERFEILPAMVFAKGFLKQYALYIGMDPEEAINFFLQSSQRAEEENPSAIVEEWKRNSTRPNPSWIIVVGVLLLLVIFWMYSRYSGGASDLVVSSSPVQASIPADPQFAQVEPNSTETETGQQIAPVVIEEENVVPPEPAFPLRVVLDFAAECWVEARVDGKQQIAELKVQGESLLLEAHEVVELKIGNIEAVDLEVNERSYVLEPKNGAVQNLRFDVASVRQPGEVGEEG